MDLFDKLSAIPPLHARLSAAGPDPFGLRMERMISATEAVIDGRVVTLAGTNNYLGLTFDPACVAASRQAIADYGTGTTGSRIANGTYHLHQDLEARIARFLGFEHCIVFSTGYTANMGMIAGLCGPNDTIMLDADCHASIYDSCRLSGATVVRFRHNNPADLDRRLGRLAKGSDAAGSNTLVIVEGLYSMFGDVAPIDEFVRVTKRHGAYLLVDEAHSVGVFGPRGRGVFEAQGVRDGVDFLVGTFSKSFGSIGGFAVSNHPKFPYLRFNSRPFMFTASPSPANIATVAAAIDQIEARPELRAQLWENAHALHGALSDFNLDLCAAPSPVIAVRLPDVETAVRCWNLLLREGVYVNLAIPPGTPNSASLLRCSMSAAHTPAQIAFIRDKFELVARALGAYGPARAVG